MQLKVRDFLTAIRSAPNEIKMCRICTINVSCGSCEMVSGATGGEFATVRSFLSVRKMVALT